ncbi:MAG: DUF1501 domain-containing protein [Hansschlegelia sp.]
MARVIRPGEIPAAVQAAATEGCMESRMLLSRRAMMGISVGLFSSAFLPNIASAASSDPRLLLVILRGGMDGVNVVVPHGDPAYAAMRGSIAIDRSATMALDGFFGLNPAMPAFGAMYRAGQALAVHAACVPLQTRSHFDCQDNLENGLPGLAPNATGWLNRLLTVMPKGSAVRSHGALQVGEAPLVLRGPAPVLGWSPTWFSEPPEDITGAVTTMLKMTDGTLYDTLKAGMKANALAEKTSSSDDGDVSEFRRAFRGAARLLTAANGPRIAVMSVANFDTHQNQGTTDGFLWGSLNELDTGLAEFRDYAAKIWPNTVVVMATEFGRTVHVNGDNGTDHGVGTVALLAGGAVAGGKVRGDWPGISQKNLLDASDLRPTTDLRAIFKGVLQDHVGVPKKVLDETVFPGSKAVKPMGGLVRAAPAARAPEADAAAAAAYAPAVELRPTSAIARYRAANGV